MFRSIFLLSVCAALTACATSPFQPVGPSDVGGAETVTAAYETPVLASVGDSADDPAIYIGPDGRGFIAGTDKQAGLYVFNLDGSQRSFFPVGMLNNVDLRPDFEADGETHVLLVASDDEAPNITAFLYNPVTDSFHSAGMTPTEIEPYGICLGRIDGRYLAGVTTKAGLFVQYEMIWADGAVKAERIRDFQVGGQIEGCVYDDRTARLYIAEEEGGLFSYDARPEAGNARQLLARIGENGLAADLEGVTLYPEGETGGHLIVSSQGNHSYGVWSLPDHAFRGRFGIITGPSTDGVSTTDGLDVTPMATPDFPMGFLVVQDDMDDTGGGRDSSKKQNFKIIDWRDVLAALE